MDLESLIADENLTNLFTVLKDLQTDRERIQAVQENVKQSLDLLDKYGKDAIPQLNLDGGLADFLKTPADQITPEAAKEALMKFDASLADKLENNGYTMASCYQQIISNEGFWRKLSYVFTSDFKCAAKVDELEKKLVALPKDAEEKLLATKIDFACQDKKTMIDILNFAFLALKWSKDNLPKIRELLKGLLGKAKNGDKVRNMLFQMVREFTKKLPLTYDQYYNLINGKTVSGAKLPKGKTLKELGYGKTDILNILKTFKVNASGQLKIMKELHGIISNMSRDYNVIYTDIEDIWFIFGRAIACYKYVDYFLFYISKEV